jgi:HD-GYP domain-containing protein (c-di-GMP phosphodiesterase class II)
MVSIVDLYDAMTSARVYRGPMCPFKVIDIFESEGLQKYDAHYIMTFLENIVNTYMLNRVKLNDGRVGDVVFVNRQALARPTIKCGTEFIDLSAEPSLSIEAII